MKQVQLKQITFILAAIVLAMGGSIFNISGTAFADCTGFTACTGVGYTDHDYRNHYNDAPGGAGVGYWKAYPGHNCTQYVGYMLTLNGDSGHGVAMGVAGNWDNTITNYPSWGYVMNGVAAVGSIAQWEANVGGSGSSGHVAYVESVSSSGGVTTIVVSEDNYSNGPYSWRTISSNTSSWPSRFLHIADVASSITDRIVATNSGGQIYAKDSLGYGGWNDQNAAANKVATGGNRIAMIDSGGNVWAKDGLGYGGWGNQNATATDVVVTSTGRIVIRTPGGQIYAKDSLGYGGWNDQNANSPIIAADGNRIAMIDSGGNVWAKDGIGYGGWNNQNAVATDIAVSSSGRMAILAGGHVYAKDTLSYGGWNDQNATASSISIGGNRMAIIDSSGKVWAKDGLSYGGWNDQNATASSIHVGNTGRLVISIGGMIWAKDFINYGGWGDQNVTASAINVG